MKSKNADYRRKMSTFISDLHSTDRLFLIFWASLSIAVIALHAQIPFWPEIAAANLAAAATVFAVAAAAARFPDTKALRIAHDWLAFPLVMFTYKQLYYIINPLHHGKDYDYLLAAIDRAIFRADPTVWISRFSHPIATEALQIAYSLFYVLFIVAGVELYRRQDSSEYGQFRLAVVYGFLVSYIGYLFLPAVGPRFALHDYTSINMELPGIFFTRHLRLFIDACESISPGASNSLAIAQAQRDVFPSGHTMMTIIALAFAFRRKLKTRALLMAIGTMLIIATIYLRYHYVIDVISGALLAIFCLLTYRKIYYFLQGKNERVGN
jgi:membrane-associated phospholipid phosphatase